MPDGPVPFHGRRALRAAVAHPRRPSTLLPGDLADLLLDGEHSPHPVATLLAAARGPATAHELSGEAAARQAFADAAPLATPTPLPTDRERRGRHRRIRAVRTVVTAKVVGVAALTLTAGGVAVAATGPSGAPAEERVSPGPVPGADAEPGPDRSTSGRTPGAGHAGGAVADRAGVCGPVSAAAIADLARDCGDAGWPGDRSDEHRVGPGAVAFGSPWADAPQEPTTRSGPDATLSAPPTTVPPTTTPPATTPPTATPPTTVPPPSGGQDDGAGSGSSGSESPGSGSSGHGHARDDVPPRRSENTTKPESAGETRTPVTGRGAPPSP